MGNVKRNISRSRSGSCSRVEARRSLRKWHRGNRVPGAADDESAGLFALRQVRAI